jgi:hypothetical protein
MKHSKTRYLKRTTGWQQDVSLTNFIQNVCVRELNSLFYLTERAITNS